VQIKNPNQQTTTFVGLLLLIQVFKIVCAWRISNWISIVDNGITRRASLKYIMKMDKKLFYGIHY
jgi:hypothetical protein